LSSALLPQIATGAPIQPLLRIEAVPVAIDRKPITRSNFIHMIAGSWREPRVVQNLPGLEDWCSWHQIVRARALDPNARLSRARVRACRTWARWPLESCGSKKDRKVLLRTLNGESYCLTFAPRKRRR
jgi:hypothetical protein